MHKLFLTDVFLVIATAIGSYYIYLNSDFPAILIMITLAFYIFSKIIGYLILDYNNFDIFIGHLTNTSKINSFKLSGFEIFKTTLVVLLFIGFIFVSPYFWLAEAILVMMMRVWGKFFILSIIKH